jgi:voltage-gated potassium channel
MAVDPKYFDRLVFVRLGRAVLILAGILMFGTLGYFLIEGMTIFDSFYMTIITISTVGFAEISPPTPLGRALTVVIIIAGISFGTYTIGTIVRIFVEGELINYFGRRKVQKQIADMKDHFIICGYGRIGRIICDELAADDFDFVVIEQDPDAVQSVTEKNYLCIEEDATSEEALQQAGIMQARGLVTAVNSDANNVFITLTAKGLRPDIFVLARASDEGNEDKLVRAGATRVVSPYLIGGKRMGQILKRPTVADFIDITTTGNQLGLVMEEAKVREGSGLNGKNLIDSSLRRDFGVIIVAIKRPSGEMIYNPQPTETLGSGDVIVVIGKHEDLIRMKAVL